MRPLPSPDQDHHPRALPSKRVGHVTLESWLGRGGIGEVFRGWDDRLKRHVAIKALSERFEADTRAVGRFVREARLLSKLDHPGICRVYDLVEQQGRHYLVLELIEGRTLRQHAGDRALPQDELLSIAEQVLDAVAAAHEAGIVHRDLKPENIMITGDGRVKVLDFGLARSIGLPGSGPFDALSSGTWDGLSALASEAADTERPAPPTSSADGDGRTPESPWVVKDDPAALDEEGVPTERFPRLASQAARTTFMTDAGETFGTLGYMSPEQVLQEPVTPRSDLYSMGVILSELASGDRAYSERDMLRLIDQVQRAQVRVPTHLGSGLADLISDMVERRPGRRPTALEALERVRWLRDQPRRRGRRRRHLAIAVGGLALFLSVALGVGLFGHLRSERRSEIARQFSRATSDLQWQIRLGHQAPVHDLRPERRRGFERMAQLDEQMRALGPVARGPGEVALGQTALALGDAAAGREHLLRAWQEGYRPPEAAVGLALATFEQYRSELVHIRRLQGTAGHAERMAELHERLRDPALEHLEWARTALAEREVDSPSRDAGALLRGIRAAAPGAGSPLPEAEAAEPQTGTIARSASESLPYVEALIAFYESRFDDALEQARRAARELPWLHEAPLLEGRVHREIGDRARQSGQTVKSDRAYGRAREAFARAAEIGRSDPEVRLALCELAVTWMRARIYGPSAEPSTDAGTDPVGSLEGSYQLGVDACETALKLDPDDARPHQLLSALHMRRAEADGELAVKLALLRQAEALAERALSIDPANSQTWRALGHVYSVEVDWLLYHEGRKVPPALFLQLQLAYRMAGRLAPGDSAAHNALGNVAKMQAERKLRDGLSPLSSLDRSIRAYHRSLAHEEDSGVRANLAAALEVRTRWLLDQRTGEALDLEAARLSARDAARAADRALSENPDNVLAWTHRGLVLALAADAAQRAGRDPKPYLRAMGTSLERSVELNPSEEFFARPARARAALVELRSRLESDDPGDETSNDTSGEAELAFLFAEARALAESVRELDAGQAEILLARLARLELLDEGPRSPSAALEAPAVSEPIGG